MASDGPKLLHRTAAAPVGSEEWRKSTPDPSIPESDRRDELQQERVCESGFASAAAKQFPELPPGSGPPAVAPAPRSCSDHICEHIYRRGVISEVGRPTANATQPFEAVLRAALPPVRRACLRSWPSPIAAAESAARLSRRVNPSSSSESGDGPHCHRVCRPPTREQCANRPKRLWRHRPD